MIEDSFIAGSYYNSNISAEENSQYTKTFSRITEHMVEAMTAGLPPDSEQMQEAVHRHYEFILQFWTPDKETYKSLAMNYILPTEFKDHYEGVQSGLGRYIYEAVCIYADNKL